MRRVPCTVWLFRDWAIRGGPISGQWVPVYYTRTYWGAKRIAKRIVAVVGDARYVSIGEVWNPRRPWDATP